MTAIAPTKAATVIPTLPATSSPPIHCEEPVPAVSTTTRHAERGPARDAEHERVGQRIAEDRLHLCAAQTEGRSGEPSGNRPLDADLAHDVECPLGRFIGPEQGVEHLDRRQAHRTEGQGGEDGDQEQPAERREGDDVAPSQRARCCRDRRGYDGGTSLRNTNSWSGTRSGWRAPT